MEIERKGIRCSYSVLVIILFAALAFVVDYAVIERKMNKCSCPDCSGNTVGESDILNYSYKDIAGYYTINFEFDSDQTDSDGASVFLHLYDDGTYSYRYSYISPYGTIGNYIIVGNTIVMNDFAKTSSGAGFDHLGIDEVSNRILIINFDGSLTDNNAPMSEVTGVYSINLVKNQSDPIDYNEFRRFINYDGN